MISNTYMMTQGYMSRGSKKIIIIECKSYYVNNFTYLGITMFRKKRKFKTRSYGAL